MTDLQSAITILRSFGAKVVLLTMPSVDPNSRLANGLPWSEILPAVDRIGVEDEAAKAHT